MPFGMSAVGLIHGAPRRWKSKRSLAGNTLLRLGDNIPWSGRHKATPFLWEALQPTLLRPMRRGIPNLMPMKRPSYGTLEEGLMNPLRRLSPLVENHRKKKSDNQPPINPQWVKADAQVSRVPMSPSRE
jgi:hypothetical protein